METEELIGRKIVEVRLMTDDERAEQYWDGYRGCSVLILDNGAKIFPSMDEEGNDSGALFGVAPNGDNFMVYP